MSKRILLVDDEPLILKGLKFALEQDGYETDTAADGEEALKKLESSRFDLMLLDVMLPKISGMEVCQTIRETSDIPIIMLTAKGEDMDKILGLEFGADDYMTKPFNILEVKARVKSILRRASSSANDGKTLTISKCGINLDITTRNVTVNGEEVILTIKEFDLLRFLMTNPGKVFTREELVRELWGRDYLDDASPKEQEKRVRTVDVHIRRLREKIESDDTKPEHIMTQWGAGYYFAE